MCAQQEQRTDNRVTLVGGSGFVGTAIAKRLAESGVSFDILDIRPSAAFPDDFQKADVRDEATLTSVMRGQAIVHLAAVHRDDVRPVALYDQVNVDGTRNLCVAAENLGIERIVFASSVAVYGFAPAGTDETGALAPFNDYGRTKAEAEAVLRAWQAREPKRRSLVIIRPTVIFGPGNRGNVFNLLASIASGRFIMIGPGTNVKSMAFVENVADFFIASLHRPPGVWVSNYVDGPELDMNTLVALVRSTLTGRATIGPRLPIALALAVGRIADGFSRLTGRRLPISYIRVRKFVSTTAFKSCNSVPEAFRPRFTLTEGLRATIVAEFLNPDPSRTIFETE